MTIKVKKSDRTKSLEKLLKQAEREAEKRKKHWTTQLGVVNVALDKVNQSAAEDRKWAEDVAAKKLKKLISNGAFIATNNRDPLPAIGPVVGYKVIRIKDKVSGCLVGNALVLVEVPANAKRRMDLAAHDYQENYYGRKCRASALKVLSIIRARNLESREEMTLTSKHILCSDHDRTYEYVLGKTHTPNQNFYDMPGVCYSGMHFFLTEALAVSYMPV